MITRAQSDIDCKEENAIYLPREIINSYVYSVGSGECFKIYIYILLSASRKEEHPNMYSNIKTIPGELLTLYSTISKNTGIPIDRVKRNIALLVKHGYITLRKESRFLIISIQDFDMYLRSA